MIYTKMFSFLVLFFFEPVQSNFISDFLQNIRTVQEMRSANDDHEKAKSSESLKEPSFGRGNLMENDQMMTHDKHLSRTNEREKSSTVGTYQKYEIADVFAFEEVIQ